MNFTRILLLLSFVYWVACDQENEGDSQTEKQLSEVEIEQSSKPMEPTETNQTETSEEKKVVIDDSPDSVEPRQTCVLDSADSNTSFTMEKIVELINKLPKPVTIPCVLDVLPRPLKLNATTSELSVQPAVGASNPRIFIFQDDFVLTFALAGDGAKTLEFSQLLSDQRSIKGEIEFPVTVELPNSAPFDRIIRSDFPGTRCAGCHFEEERAGGSFPENAFASKALRPFVRQDFPIEKLKELLDGCTDLRSLKCELLQAIFKSGDPVRQDFPSNMPTLF